MAGDDTKPRGPSNHVDTDDRRPASDSADRAFIDIVTTCGAKASCARISSAKVGVAIRAPLSPPRAAAAPYETLVTAGSSVQDTSRPAARSYHTLAIMPWICGMAPVPMVACPAQVIVLAYRYAASV